MLKTNIATIACIAAALALHAAASACGSGAGDCQSAWMPGFGGSAGTNDGVNALAVFDDGTGPALYVGGWFTSVNGVTVNRIAKYDGTEWTSLGTGMNGWVNALTVFDDGTGPALYATGAFTSADGVSATRIAKWDGQTWSPLESGLNHIGFALAAIDADEPGGPALYVGGRFTTAGGINADYIAKWDGTAWSNMDSGMNSYVYTLEAFDDGSGPAIYAGGHFTAAGGGIANRIARWDDVSKSWTALSTGMSGSVSAMTVIDANQRGDQLLIAGGYFNVAGGEWVSRIAAWDGSTWSPLGSGMNGPVHALTVFDDGSGSGPTLYAAGEFTEADDAAASFIAQWDGSTWLPVGAGTNDQAAAMASINHGRDSEPTLYIGGDFTLAGAVSANHLARWQGCHDASPCQPADLNCDGVTNVGDLLLLLSAWGACPPRDACPADLNNDDVVNVGDLLILLSAWG